jgi:hypothetical protein
LFCTDSVVWNTNTNVFRAACGRDGVEALIQEKLPKVICGCSVEFPRHRLALPTEGTGVIGPDGTRHHFEVALDEGGLIKTLTRTSI